MRLWTTRRLMILVLQAALLLGFVVVVIPDMRSSHCGPWMRTSACHSNLRQLGIGIDAYTNVHGYLPPGTIANPSLSVEDRPGWGLAILPDLVGLGMDAAELDLTQAQALSLAWSDPALAGLANQVPFAHCPGDRGRANYVAIAGLGVDAPALPNTHPRAGIFGDDRRVTPADIKDGMASTMMVAETDWAGAPWFAGGRATVRGLDPGRQPYIGPGRQFGGNHRTSRNPLFAREGANVLFADGSVRFITDSIDPRVFEAMSTMAGGEKVSAPWDD